MTDDPLADQPHVLLLVFGDRSGIQGAWGPFRDKYSAVCARRYLEAWPMSGIWEIHPCWPDPTASPTDAR